MENRPLIDCLRQNLVLISDGALATSLYDKGFYINRSFEELSLTHSESVLDVLSSFKKAGSQLLSTNTFSATRPKLTKYGIQDKLNEIIVASTQLTKKAANGSGYTMATIGPLGVVLEPLGPTSVSEASLWFSEMVEAFESVGVDGYSLESFHDLKELELAIRAVQKFSTKPILAHIALQEGLKTSYGHSIEEFVDRVTPLGVAALGFAGEVGPSGMLSALEEIRPLTDLPVSVKPNAGLPQYVNDQYIYLCNPDYLAKYSKRFIQAGAQIVGGGAGVTEAHIRAMSNTVRMLVPQVKEPVVRVSSTDVESAKLGCEPTPKPQRSELARQLMCGERVFTVEINPPKGVDCEGFFKHCQDLVRAGVKYVNIPDGARAVARMSSLQLASFVKNKFNLEPIPHFTCRDRNLIGLQSDLLGAFVNGVRNVLLVTGDPPKLGNCPDATAVYDVDAIGLTHIVSRMNRGLDLGGSEFGAPTEFMVGVALNPTAHNQELELQRFAYKCEAGADYAITQPIYDVDAYLKFMDRVGECKIPVVMGIWPLVSLRNAEFLRNEVPGVQVPDWVIHEMEKAGDDKDEALKRGIDIAIKTMEQAKSMVAGFQVSAPFNRVSIAVDVINAI
jgi:5,10-methylenetetrahydrofolate reductase/methionine synthase I (cobalamin-dependent)